MCVNDDFSRCSRLQLWEGGVGGGVFSSLCCFPEVEVEWVAALKANLHPPHSSENLLPPHNKPTAVCYVISKQRQFSCNHRANWGTSIISGGGVEEALHGELWFGFNFPEIQKSTTLQYLSCLIQLTWHNGAVIPAEFNLVVAGMHGHAHKRHCHMQQIPSDRHTD